jgi:ABC-type bacteriocin/lantibiotic exporter with double-glycine peptidase domain
LVLALILWIIFKFTGPKGLASSLKESKYKYNLAHWLEEIARVNKSFKLFSGNKFHLNKTDCIVEDYLVSREKHFQVLISQFKLFIGFKVIVAAGLLLLGGYLVFQEQMNIGQFVAAEIIIILIINSIEKVLRTIDTIYDVLTALDKIGYVTDLPLDNDGGNAIITTEKGVSLTAKELVFGFPDEKNKIINKLSFEVKANEKIVLTGKSGSGKSVLIQLLAGLHEIEDGELYIDDIPFSNYKREKIHQHFGVAFPDNQIFEGTFKENILLGRSSTDKEISTIVKLLKLDDYLIHQPQGIDSLVDSGGRRLPRSILQKLLIARIIISAPKLLLIEDPLQFIEEDEKKIIIDYIMDDKRNWTVLVISDFYYWKEKCTRIIEINKN